VQHEFYRLKTGAGPVVSKGNVYSGYSGGDAACNEWRIRSTGLYPSQVLCTGGVQFAPNLVFLGRECDLMIPTLPENAEGGGKSTPPVHPNAPLPLFDKDPFDYTHGLRQNRSGI